MSQETAFTSGQLAKFIKILADEGVTYDRFQEFLESGVAGDVFDPTANLQDRVAICQAMKVDPEKRGMLFFEINYSNLVLADLYKATGVEGSAPEHILQAPIPETRLPEVMGVVRYEAKLFEYRRSSFRNVRRRIYSAGWIPAGHEHALAFLAKYRQGEKPDLSTFDVVSLSAPVTIMTTYCTMESGCWRVLHDSRSYKKMGGLQKSHRYLAVRQIS